MGVYDPTKYDRSFERSWSDMNTRGSDESKEQEILRDFLNRVVAELELPQTQAATINAAGGVDDILQALTDLSGTNTAAFDDAAQKMSRTERTLLKKTLNGIKGKYAFNASLIACLFKA